ncbi:hypothetical protein Bbelb_158220 [Branchiostoma belcheri]|nr:hypothetical protein Bbelb_158220 [Branchiostoma belcheri]
MHVEVFIDSDGQPREKKRGDPIVMRAGGLSIGPRGGCYRWSGKPDDQPFPPRQTISGLTTSDGRCGTPVIARSVFLGLREGLTDTCGHRRAVFRDVSRPDYGGFPSVPSGGQAIPAPPPAFPGSRRAPSSRIHHQKVLAQSHATFVCRRWKQQAYLRSPASFAASARTSYTDFIPIQGPSSRSGRKPVTMKVLVGLYCLTCLSMLRAQRIGSSRRICGSDRTAPEIKLGGMFVEQRMVQPYRDAVMEANYRSGQTLEIKPLDKVIKSVSPENIVRSLCGDLVKKGVNAVIYAGDEDNVKSSLYVKQIAGELGMPILMAGGGSSEILHSQEPPQIQLAWRNLFSLCAESPEKRNSDVYMLKGGVISSRSVVDLLEKVTGCITLYDVCSLFTSIPPKEAVSGKPWKPTIHLQIEPTYPLTKYVNY